jgi:nuclear protein localization family protein 4
MGIKAVVEVIHEPPQEGNTDGLSLELPWEDEERVIAFAHAAGMNLVGTVFTDLSPTPEDKTKVIYKRHQGSFYLSSLEASFAAQIQLSHPNPSRSSPTGIYGSRIVTTILTGDDKGDVSVAAYQVSEQACAMLDADMIEPSVDPGTMRVKEEESGRYVPDVFYRFKNDYGLEVKQSAKPCFPVEYLLVNVSPSTLRRV